MPVLIQAIYDPDKNTIAALDALLSTSFVHVIDVPSLALIMPILSRALKDRKTEVKKKSAQVRPRRHFSPYFLTEIVILIARLWCLIRSWVTCARWPTTRTSSPTSRS